MAGYAGYDDGTHVCQETDVARYEIVGVRAAECTECGQVYFEDEA